MSIPVTKCYQIVKVLDPDIPSAAVMPFIFNICGNENTRRNYKDSIESHLSFRMEQEKQLKYPRTSNERKQTERDRLTLYPQAICSQQKSFRDNDLLFSGSILSSSHPKFISPPCMSLPRLIKVPCKNPVPSIHPHWFHKYPRKNVADSSRLKRIKDGEEAKTGIYSYSCIHSR